MAERKHQLIELDRLEKVADTLLGTRYETWNFGESVAFEAMLNASRVLSTPKYVEFAHGWLRGWAARAEPFVRLDHTAPGFAAVHVAQVTNDDDLVTQLTKLAHYLISRPKVHGLFETWESSPLRPPYGPTPLDSVGARLLANPPAGSFVDCLHFDPPFFTALGTMTRDSELVETGIEQASRFIEVLQDSDGFFWHFVLADSPQRYGPRWGRGQGWALLGLLDVIETLQQHEGKYDAEIEVFSDSVRSLISAMVASQEKDGHWPARILSPDPTHESSTAAFMSAGFTRALRLGIVSGSDVEKSRHRALDAVDEALDDSGVLTGVSAAVMACTEPTHYDRVPTGFMVPWGQGPAVLALCEEARSD